MKHFAALLLLILFKCATCAFGQAPAQTAEDYIRPYDGVFQYGANLGYYNANWPDEKMAGIAQALGVHSIRPTLPEGFLAGYGYNIRENTFKAYASTYGMKELTCFLESPSAAHRDMTTYPGGTQPSRLFAHLYEPIWNGDGSVNQNNYYAYYLYQMQLIYGDNVRFWEIVNEPDYTYGASQNQWLTRPPLPDEVSNLRAPIFNYIRMLRISYEVLKKYRPDAYITTGGVGYPQFVDALLRYTDNPDGGAVTADYPHTAGAYLDALSFHSYPNYSMHYWDGSINGFRYTRTSDYAVEGMLKDRQAMVDVLSKYGYDGNKYPVKHLLMSETNVGRRTSDDRISSDAMQRNYGIKTLVLAQRNSIKQFYIYQLGESVNAPAPGVSVSGADEISLMGLYENLNRDAPGSERLTELGQAFATTSKLLYGWQYDAARTAALALPNNLNGAAFQKNGTYSYVLWARALVDASESASGTYSFPAAWSLANVQRYEWNYSATNARTTTSAQNIPLTETPLFFTEGNSSSVVLSGINPSSAVVGASVTLTGSNLAGATRVNFNGAATTIFTSNSATQVVLNVPSGASSGPVNVITANGTSNSVSFTVAACPVATISYGAAAFCQSGPNPVPTVTGPTGGTFTAPAGLSVNAATGVIGLAASRPGTYIVTYSAPSAYCPTSATAQVIINMMPVAQLTAGAITFCKGGATVLSATPVVGATYQFMRNGQAIAGATAASYTATGGGSYTVRVSLAGGCAATSAVVVLTEMPKPTPPKLTATRLGGGVLLSSSESTGNQFYLNGKALAAATSPTYTVTSPAKNGVYTVMITSATGCLSDPSEPVAVSLATITATTASLAGGSLSVYPNPTPDGHLTIDFMDSQEAGQLSVLNALGQVVYTAAVPAHQGLLQLDLHQLATGVYSLRVQTKEGVATRRFVRQ